jgi:hypothetical protein
MSFEKWLRCDGCGNALELAEEAVPEGWVVFTPERGEDGEPAIRPPSGYALLFGPSARAVARPSLHLCSWGCAENLARMQKEAA